MQKHIIPASTALSLLPLLPLLPLVGCTTNETHPKALPNILCIVCEDISPMLGCFGDRVSVTPNLDRFSTTAIRYNAYSSIGVSAPSRYSLITGRYPSADGANYMRTVGEDFRPEGIEPYEVIAPEGVKCYTEYLREIGFYCTNNAKTDYQFEAPLTAWDECGGSAHYNNRATGQPFFAIFNLGVTHEGQIWGRNDLPLSVDPSDIVVPPYYPDNDTIRHDMAVAYSNITEMDRQFQRLIDELKASGEYDNTIIIWYSDNGGPLPLHKRELYDRGAQVPFMIHYPTNEGAGTFSEDMIAFVDIPATILSLCGIEPKDYMHGTPFAGTYQGESRQYIYGAKDRMDECIDKQSTVRDSRYRYVKNYLPGTVGYRPVVYRTRMAMMRNMLSLNSEGSLDSIQSRWFNTPRLGEEFYDRETDPYELTNQIDNPAYATEIARLRTALDKWDREYNTHWHLSERENLDRIHPNGTTPKSQSPKASVVEDILTVEEPSDSSSIAYRISSERENSWQLYTSPIKVPQNAELEIIATRIGYTSSDIVLIRNN